MKRGILVAPLVAVIMVFTAVSLGHARSPYVPNVFSYDPEWKGDLPKIGGYVDVYWTYSQAYDGQYNGLEAQKVDFTVDRFEGYIQHRVTDWADGYFEISVDTWLKNDTQISLDEAWLRVVVPWGSGLTLMGGVYDVPIGIGANENIDIWNWQFKMVNIMVAPWAFTGGLIEYEIAELVNINFWIANDWSHSEVYGFARTGRVDPDTDKVFGGRIGVSPDEMFDVGVSVVWGNERLDEEMGYGASGSWQSRTMVDLDFRWLDLPDFLGALDFEVWWLELTDTPVIGGPAGLLENSQAYGGVAQFNFATPMESLSVSLAYEVIWDENGIVFGGDPNELIDLGNQTRQSVEVTPIWAIGDHVIVALTWRTDWSNKDVFTNNDGNPTDFTWLTAWEWYYYF